MSGQAGPGEEQAHREEASALAGLGTTLRRVHFVGIGGIGMSALAEVMHGQGYDVSGSDLRPSPLIARLRGLGFPVDRHVLRVSNRLGLVQTENPTSAELLLKKIFLQSAWTHVSDVLIQHGRKICKPRPHCDKCSVRRHCKYQIQYAPPVRTA